MSTEVNPQRSHILKTLPEYFSAVASGEKTFEARRNDRGFRVGDTLILKEWDGIMQRATGRELKAQVSYILEGGAYGVEFGFCILALKDVEPV